MPILNATIGGARSNSYLTYAEANAYFDERLALAVPWSTSGQEAALIMATRVLDALAQPFKTLFPGPPAYYRIRRQWTGTAATAVQRLAWPRVGMLDQNGTPLDVLLGSNSATDPTVFTTAAEHHLQDNQEVLIFGVEGSVPDVNGPQVATVVSPTAFSVPVAVTTSGTGGRVTTIPLTLKHATAELAGQLIVEDRTLDNDVILQGITSLKAGSVAIGFNKEILQQVIPQSVYDMLPYGWLTDEGYEPALRALFDVVSDI